MNIEEFLNSLDWRSLNDDCSMYETIISYEDFLKYFGEFGGYPMGEYCIYVEKHTVFSVHLTCY